MFLSSLLTCLFLVLLLHFETQEGWESWSKLFHTIKFGSNSWMLFVWSLIQLCVCFESSDLEENVLKVGSHCKYTRTYSLEVSRRRQFINTTRKLHTPLYMNFNFFFFGFSGFSNSTTEVIHFKTLFFFYLFSLLWEICWSLELNKTAFFLRTWVLKQVSCKLGYLRYMED